MSKKVQQKLHSNGSRLNYETNHQIKKFQS